MPVSRRTLLGLVSSGTVLLSAGTLGGVLPPGAPRLDFPQGVASGDPQPDGIMLWTRAVPREPHSGVVALRLQLSRSAGFEVLLLDTGVSTDPQADYTVRAYVDRLQADTVYYYRFLGAAGSVSRTGRTRTAPSPETARDVRLAFASCQSYEQGHYGNWARMLADDLDRPEDQQIDFVLHLGDFIYERTWPRLSDGTPVPRPLPPFPDGARGGENSWAVTLADYRHLYKTYLSDPHLQAARARWPFVCTWDDHEFSNDNFGIHSSYGEEHKAESARKLAANRAWFEFIPTVLDELEGQPAHDFRQPGNEADAVDSLRIYRSLHWGKYLDIILTDSRSYRTPPCLPSGLAETLGLPLDTVLLVEMADAGKAWQGGRPDPFLPYGDGSVENPGRERAPGTMLGLEQRQWLLERLEHSGAHWKLWANALPLIPMRIDLGSLPFAGYEHSIFHLDAWAGFPYEQSVLLHGVEAAGVAGLVSFSGDHHMHGVGTVKHNAGDTEAAAVTVDFSVAGISSSPMFGELEQVSRKSHAGFASLVFSEDQGRVIPVWNMTMLDGALAALAYGKTGLKTAARWLGPNAANPGLRYIDSTANGYGLAHFSARHLSVEMVTLNSVREAFTEPPPIDYIARFELPLWQPGGRPELTGPEFEGGAPFPFDPPSV